MSHFYPVSQNHSQNNKLQNNQYYYYQKKNSLQQQQSQQQQLQQIPLQQKRSSYHLIRQHNLISDISKNNSDENPSNIYEVSSATNAAALSNMAPRKLPVVKNLFENNNLMRPNTSPKIGNYTYFQPPRATYILGPSGSCASVVQQGGTFIDNNSIVPPSPSPRSPAELYMYTDRISFF